MKKFIKNNFIFLLPILSGALLILANPPYDLGFLIWIALIPLFWFIFLKQISLKKALIGGFFAGVLFFGKLFSWFFATAPFEWLGITIKKDIALVFCLIIIIWVAQTIFLGLFFGIFSWITKKMAVLSATNFSPRSAGRCLIIIPCLWIVFEYLRAWGFGIFWLGKETLFGPHWTFGNLAYALHGNSYLIQLADITGIYGISFLIVLVNVIFFFLIKQCVRPSLTHKNLAHKQIMILVILLILVGVGWTGYGAYKLKIEEKGIQRKIALLQTNFLSGAEFDAYQKKEVFKAVLDLFSSFANLPADLPAGEAGGARASENRPDIVIAPEGFGIVSLTGDKEIAKYLLKDFWQPGQIFLENQKVIDENGKAKSRSFYYDLEKENPLGFHDKMLLIPGGDYLPYSLKILLEIYSFNMKYEQRLYKRGEKVEAVQTPKGNIGGTICSSILSPDINRQMTKTGAELLVVVSSDAPFHGSEALLTQNLAISQLRAVENRRYFAQATNMGYSFLLNSKGEIVIKSSQLGNEILFSNIYLLNKKTVYTKSGDWVIILSTIMLLLTFILWYNNKKEKRVDSYAKKPRKFPGKSA